MAFSNALDEEMAGAGVAQFNPGYYHSTDFDAVHVFIGLERVPKRKVDDYLWIYGPPGDVAGVRIYQVSKLLVPAHYTHAIKPIEDCSVLVQLVMFNYFMLMPLTVEANIGISRWTFICRQLVT